MARPSVQKAKERYRELLNQQLPTNKTRDIKPTKSSLLGCLLLKIALVFLIGAYLLAYSTGLGGVLSAQSPFAFMAVLADISIGLWIYFILTIFTELYIRKKSGLFGTIAFIILIGLIIGTLSIWAENINAYEIPIIIRTAIYCILGVLSLIWDLVNLINVRKST